jgi:type IV pilus modification protein PilV
MPERETIFFRVVIMMQAFFKRVRQGGRLLRQEQGFTLIEVMMAMVVLGIGIFSIAALQTRDMAYNNASKRQAEGYTLALDRMERLRAADYINDVKTASEVQGGYTVVWNVKAGGVANTKQVDIQVQWNNRDVATVSFTRTEKFL